MRTVVVSMGISWYFNGNIKWEYSVVLIMRISWFFMIFYCVGIFHEITNISLYALRVSKPTSNWRAPSCQHIYIYIWSVQLAWFHWRVVSDLEKLTWFKDA